MKRSLVSSLFALLAAVLIVPASASACNKDFVVYNETDTSITQVYVSPHSSNTWEDDLLTDASSIEPDTSRRINMQSDTREVSLYDVKAVFEDSAKVEGGKINLCRATKVYIYSDHITYE